MTNSLLIVLVLIAALAALAALIFARRAYQNTRKILERLGQ